MDKGSLRNDDILAVIQSKVPARLKEIETRLAALSKEFADLDEEKAKLLRISEASAHACGGKALAMVMAV